MKSKGFTLIELMIVLTVIIVLIGILVPRFMEARYRAQVAVAIVELRSIAIALGQHFIDRGTYPEPSELTEFKTDYLSGKDPVWPWDKNDRILVADVGSLEYSDVNDGTSYIIEKKLPSQIQGIAGLMSGYAGLKEIALTPERGVHFLPLPP